MKICKLKGFLVFVIVLLYCDDASARRKNESRNRQIPTKRKGKCRKPDPVKHAELKENYGKKIKFNDGERIEYNCKTGYTIDGTSTERVCKQRKWSEVQFTCNDLTANITQRNVTDAQNDSMDQEKDKSKEENYYINANSENFDAEVANDSLSSEQVEERCSFTASEACFFEDDNKQCKKDDFEIQSGSSVNIRCDTRHQLFVSENKVKGQGSLNCKNGSYPNFQCIPSKTKYISDLTANITQGNVTDAQNDSKDQDKDKSKEENYYINTDSENFDAEEANDNLSSEQVEGCTLSDDQRYKYVNMHDIEIKPGEKIAVGMTLKVQCKFIDMYSFLTYDYENYTNYEDSVEPTITCNNDNEMSKHSLTCTEENKNDECMKVDNGEVRKSNWYYIVSCNDGFSLETIVREGERCTCNNGILTSIIGGQPKCLPDPCLVPYDFDSRISISDRYFVSLSGGSVVQVGEIVFFNCSKSSDGLYEPFNRRFKCKNGLWIEDERDKTWKLGNNGTFPECRKAKCEPKCQNGGFCYKDNFCRCKHLTEGKHCEKVICDGECNANGGKCIGPGKCECPLDRFGINCRKIGCKLPDLENMKNLQFSKDVFPPGETIQTLQCKPGYYLSSNHGMTCQNDGLWSDEVECVKGIVYLISTKTGSRRYAGTNAKVNVILLGAGGSTRRIDFDGNFEKNDVDEIRTMAKDIRPIKSVHIEHDGSGVGPGWYLDYVSIYVENMEEFYVFRNKEHLWVMEDKDLTLSKEEWQGNNGNDSCIDSFGRELKGNATTEFHLGQGAGMSIRGCKQACINHGNCRGVYYEPSEKGGTCDGFATTEKLYFDENRDNLLGSVYLRKCKDNF